MELTHNGITDTVAGWSRRTGIPETTLASRLGKLQWGLERALTARPARRTIPDRERGNKVCRDCDEELPLAEFYAGNSKGGWTFSRCRGCWAAYHNSRRRDNRERVIDHYSKGTRQCAACGENRFAVLDLDHIHGGGYLERRIKKKSSQQLYLRLIREEFPPGFQILCRNCNWLKFIESDS